MVRMYEGTWVHPDAEIAEDVEIGAFTCIGPHVKIGRGTSIGNNCNILGRTTIGERNRIFSNAVLGSEPQDLKFRGEVTRLEIGDGNTIREFVTMNVGTSLGGGLTRIGNGNLVMACAHVAHDCIVGDRCILANNVLLGGHIKIESDVILSGGSVVHHFATLGQHSFVGGLTRVPRDVPPYMIFVGSPAKVLGVNIVGLKRRGFTHDQISALKEAHRSFFRSGKTFNDAADECRDLVAMFADVRYLVDFMRTSQTGKFGRALEAQRDFV